MPYSFKPVLRGLNHDVIVINLNFTETYLTSILWQNNKSRSTIVVLLTNIIDIIWTDIFIDWKIIPRFMDWNNEYDLFNILKL